MPRYSIQGPDGKTYSIDGPEGATREEVIAAIQQQQAIQKEQQRQHEAKTGFMPALKAGARGFIGGAEEALGFDKAAAEQFQKAAQTYEGITPEDIARAKEEGVFSTLGAYKTKYITEPLGGIVGRFGAPMAAAAVLPESLIGAGAGAALARAGTMALTDLPAEVGENIQRQKERGEEVNRSAATIAGLAQATIAAAGIPGSGAITKLLGPRLLAEAEALAPRVRAGVLTQEEAVQQLSSKGIEFARATAANAVTGTGLMVGTEELRRLQAGQELMTPEELKETAIQAAAIAPIFGALHGFGARGKAEAALTEAQKAREEDVKKILDTKYKLASLDEKVRLQKLFEDEQFKEQLRTKIHSETDKPVQQIIDETLGIGETTGKTAADVKAALNEPSGQWVTDPETQVERELTVGELQKIQRPDLFTGEEAKVVEENIVTDKTLTDLGIGASTPLVKQGGLRNLDLNKPEEAQQFIEGLTAFKDQKGLKEEIKTQIEAKIKEVQDKLKEAEDERLKSATDRENIQVSRESLGGGAERGEELVGDRTAEFATDIGSAKMGAEGRRAPLAPEQKEVMKGEEKTQPIYKGVVIPESLIKAHENLAAAEEARNVSDTPINKTRETKAAKKWLNEFRQIEPSRDPNESGNLNSLLNKIVEERQNVPKLAVGEIPLTRETPETIITALKDRFGNNINKAIDRGDVKLIESKDLPSNVAPDAVAYYDKGVAHLITDRLSREEAPRKLLHEVGVHYGLEGMLGKALYKDVLRTINRLKETDKDIKAAHEHVNNKYKELVSGSREHAEEVLARLGESAPNHSILRRVLAAIKEFLYKKGLWNVNKMDVHDLHDLINRSTARSLAGKVKPTIREERQYAKGEERTAPISDRYKDTAIFASPAEEADKSFQEHVGGILDRAKNIDRNTIDRAFTGARIKVANPAAGVQTELIRKYNGAVLDAMGNMRADLAHDQALNSNILGATSAKEGRVVLSKTEGAKVVKDPDNLYAIFDELEKLSTRIGAVDAEHVGGAYLQALRYSEILNANDRYDTQIKNLEAQLKKDRKEAYAKNTAKDTLEFKKLEDKVAQSISKLKDKKKTVTKEQQDAIPAALKYADEFPEIKRIAEIYDKQRLNEIDMLEQAGIYGKEFAQELRETKGYVPLFRLMDDLENITPGARQHFRGLADIGKEHAFEGSERRAMNIFDNMLTRHMWAVNAATRNFANRRIADELAMRKEDGTLKTYNILPEGKADVMTPIWIDGKRTFVEYADPFFARAVYGMEPALPGILGWFGKASKILRTGVTALPTFQAYQVFNDATRAAMLSGVKHPFKLIGEVVGSFGKILKDENDPIVKEMNRLGISGGYGHTAKEVADKMRRERGMLATSLTQKAFDRAEKFAATSDMAQRRALFRRTLLETGGVEQADGSIIGGNKVLAMDRAMNIIHWQKRGASNTVRVLTQIVPFMNAYLQGMDILIRSMRGEGISGRERKEAQYLFASTAVKLMALSAVYSMVVSSDEEYQKLDDRTKIRSLIIPGTGVKIPVANEVAMLVKAVPELTWQYAVRADTNNPMDSTKLLNEIGRSFVDGLASPNLMPQGVRGIVEVATNHNFLTGNPIVGRGLEHLETSEQFTENTSELAKFIGNTGVISPLKLDHLLKGYGGTMAAGGLYLTDAFANLFYDNKLPTTSLHKIPVVSSFMYSPNGKDQLNDYYDLKDRSDEVTATLNKYLKFGTKEQIKEYSEENRAMINARSQINQIGNIMKILREQRKLIINSNLSSDEKRAKIDEIDVRINKQVENIGALRIKAGL